MPYLEGMSVRSHPGIDRPPSGAPEKRTAWTSRIWLVLAVLWAGVATGALFAGFSSIQFDGSALIKAAAVLGAFVLFGLLVSTNERSRATESALDQAFDMNRERPSAD
jgi:hypothetical protein